MNFDPSLYWCTDKELLEDANSEKWFDCLLAYLIEKQFDGVLAISSADAFSIVNEKLGREAGDSVLKRVWESLSGDEWVKFSARLDGDGLIFVIDLTQATYTDFIKKHMTPFSYADSESICRSLGFSSIPNEWTGSEDDWINLIQATAMAETHAKKRGGNMAIQCLNPLGLLSEDVNEFYRNNTNFEVIKSGEPSRQVYEPR